MYPLKIATGITTHNVILILGVIKGERGQRDVGKGGRNDAVGNVRVVIQSCNKVRRR